MDGRKLPSVAILSLAAIGLLSWPGLARSQSPALRLDAHFQATTMNSGPIVGTAPETTITNPQPQSPAVLAQNDHPTVANPAVQPTSANDTPPDFGYGPDGPTDPSQDPKRVQKWCKYHDRACFPDDHPPEFKEDHHLKLQPADPSHVLILPSPPPGVSAKQLQSLLSAAL